MARRRFLATGAAALAGLAAPNGGILSRVGESDSRFPIPYSRPIKQSVSRWPYSKIPLPEFAKAAKGIGLAGVDLLRPDEWDVVRDAGLVPSMGYPTDRKDF
jgi:hydroxypyruvate isomerase